MKEESSLNPHQKRLLDALLSYGGVYNPDIVDRVIGVTLTMNVSGSEETIMFEKNVTIKSGREIPVNTTRRK